MTLPFGQSVAALVSVLFFLFGLQNPAFSIEPPDAREAAKMRAILALKGPLSPTQTAQLAEVKQRLRNARKLGNHRVDPLLLRQAINRAADKHLNTNGKSESGIADRSRPATPPLRWRGMPSLGDVKVFALLIDFSDHPAKSTSGFVHSGLYGNGNVANAPHESLANYYTRASYGQLDLSHGATFGWYRPAVARSAVEQTTPGRDSLIKEALLHFDAQGHDFSQYDNNNDGVIDYFLVIWTGPNNGWSNFWWGYQTRYSVPSFKLDDVSLGKYSWQWESRNNDTAFNPSTVIHETGHALGLPDYYDYDDSIGPRGGIGAMDIMHSQRGDHNCFSKWVLDWVTPTVISSGSQSLNLLASGTAKDCVVAWPGLASGSPFSEFFVIQNRQRLGNDLTLPGDGILAWHVDASLNAAGTDYAYDNSYTDHKLIRLMEADGLEQIEQGGAGDAGDYYKVGRVLDAVSSPNTLRYAGPVSGVALHSISPAGQTMQATIAIGPQDTLNVSPQTGFTSEKEPGTGAGAIPQSATYLLKNNGTSTLDWTASADVSWVDLSASAGQLDAGEQISVIVSLNEQAAALSGGVYEGMFRFANKTLGIGMHEKPIRFSVIDRPQNDHFESAAFLSSRTGSVTINNQFATEQSGEPKHGDKITGGKSVWWKWVPQTSGEVVFDAKGSDFDTMMSVYGGHSLARLSALADDDDSAGDRNALVKFTAQAGMTYYIAVDGWNKLSGTIKLNWAQSFFPPPLLASILPSARSGSINAPLSAFASLINTGNSTATSCSMALQAGQSSSFGYQTTSAANTPTGAADTPVNIAPGQIQNFVFKVTPDRVLNSEQMGLVFDCTNTIAAASVPGLNRIVISASAGAVPDLIAIAATPNADGIVNVPGDTGTGVFSVATVNIGASGSFTASVDDADLGLPLGAFICKTDAQGACENDPASNVAFPLASNEIALFSVFVAGQGNIAFDAANHRLFLRLEQQGITRGATSVAVRTVN